MTIEELRDAVFDLCEMTEAEAEEKLLRTDLDEASKQFWRGRKYEAKGIRRTIGSLVSEDLAKG